MIAPARSPRSVTLHPNPGAQSDFLADFVSRFCLYLGGMGSGKNWGGSRKLMMLACRNRTDGIMVAQSFAQLREVMRQDVEEVCWEWNIKCHWRAGDHMLELPGIRHRRGSSQRAVSGMPRRAIRIFGRSGERGEGIASVNVGYGWSDETARYRRFPVEPMRDPMKQFIGRLRDRKGRDVTSDADVRQLCFTSTPEGKGALWDEFEENPTEFHRMYRGSTYDNAHNLDPDYIPSLERSYGPELARQYLRGEAVDLSGMQAYLSFGDHNVGEVTYDPDGVLYLWHDFNVAPLVAGYGQPRPPDGDPNARADPPEAVLHILGEVIIKAGGQTRDIGKQVVQVITEGGHRGPVVVFGDATGASGSTRSRLDDWQTLAEIYHHAWSDRVSFAVNRGNPAVTERVARVNAMLLNMNGDVRVKLDPKRVPVHVRDFRQVKWRASMSITGIPVLDKSNLDLTHISDAFGYMAHIAYPPIQPQMLGAVEAPMSAARYQHEGVSDESTALDPLEITTSAPSPWSDRR